MISFSEFTPETKILDGSGNDWTWAFVIFREVPGCPRYYVGTNQTLWRSHYCNRKGNPGWKRLKLARHPRSGHYLTTIYVDKKKKTKFLHDLILTAFVGPRPKGMECCHNDGRSLNNDIMNLRWDTHKSNIEDSMKHGTFRLAEMNGKRKLTPGDVRGIRKMGDEGHSYKEIGLAYGIHPSYVGRIVSRKHRSSVE